MNTDLSYETLDPGYRAKTRFAGYPGTGRSLGLNGEKSKVVIRIPLEKQYSSTKAPRFALSTQEPDCRNTTQISRFQEPLDR